MNNKKVDNCLKVVLTIFLFAVPIGLAMMIWFTPGLDTNRHLVGLSTVNVGLSLAEVMFLVRAVIFPKGGKKWWRTEDWL